MFFYLAFEVFFLFFLWIFLSFHDIFAYVWRFAMTQQAELIRNIDKLPPKFFGEIIEFVAFLQFKAQQENMKNTGDKPSSVRDIELFEMYADELNAEAEDVLSYQNMYMDEIAK